MDPALKGGDGVRWALHETALALANREDDLEWPVLAETELFGMPGSSTARPGIVQVKIPLGRRRCRHRCRCEGRRLAVEHTARSVVEDRRRSSDWYTASWCAPSQRTHRRPSNVSGRSRPRREFGCSGLTDRNIRSRMSIVRSHVKSATLWRSQIAAQGRVAHARTSGASAWPDRERQVGADTCPRVSRASSG